MPNYEALDHGGGAGITTLSAQLLAATTTTFAVVDGTGFPTGKHYIAISPTEDLDAASAIAEKLLVTRSGNTFTIASSGRGADGTTAATHPAGAKVIHVFSALEASEANDAVVQTIGKVTTAGDMLIASGAGAFSRLAKGSDDQVLRVASGSVGWGALPANSVGQTQMADNAVGRAELRDDAVGADEIEDGTITEDKLAFTPSAGIWVVAFSDETFEESVDPAPLEIGTYNANSPYMPIVAGSIIGLSIVHESTRTSGSILYEVYKNGTATGIQVTIDATNPQYHYAVQAAGTDTFVAGDKIDVRRVNSSFLANMNVQAYVHFQAS